MFFTSAEISLFQKANKKKKNRINSKVLCPESPSFLMLRPCRLREAKRAMRTRMNRALKGKVNKVPRAPVALHFADQKK